MENDAVQMENDAVSDVTTDGTARECPDCGGFLGANGRCYRCGYSAADDLLHVKLLNAKELKNPYEVEYDALLEKISAGAEPERAKREFVSEMEYKSDLGDARAQCFLAGRIYEERKSPEFIYGLLKDAADTGYHEAELRLGAAYGRGVGVERDPDAATRFYRRSALHGNALAFINLGARFRAGECVRKDPRKAIACYEHALENGYLAGARALASIYSNNDAIAPDPVREVRYLRLLANNGDAKAQFCLGNAYWRGHGVESDPGTAMMWIRLSAEHGYVTAQETLAVKYNRGSGVKQDFVESLKWLERAAAQGSLTSMLDAATCYCVGLGCRQNCAHAYYLAMNALDKGFNEALWLVSHLLRHGLGVKRDLVRADKCLVEALEGNVRAAWNPVNAETASGEFATRRRWAGEDTERIAKLHDWLVRCQAPEELCRQTQPKETVQIPPEVAAREQSVETAKAPSEAPAKAPPSAKRRVPLVGWLIGLGGLLVLLFAKWALSTATS